MLTPGIVVNLALDTFFLIYMSIAFVVSVDVVIRWDFSKNEPRQFALQKRLYLVSTITKYLLSLKISLFLYFVYTLDHLSSLINGAMCAVGVIEASPFGIYLIVIKLLDLYLFGFWLMLNNADYKDPYLPYAKLKSLFFLFIYCSFFAEVVLEYFYFFDINPQSLVSCCTSTFSSASQSWIASYLHLPNRIIYGSFYAVFLLSFVAFLLKRHYIYAVLSTLFLPIALLSLIGFFSTYIYELPTHRCPFCMLQSEYHSIGYPLYTTLFLGTFFGIVGGFFKKTQKYLKLSFTLLCLYTALVSYFPLSYYITQGKWLYS